MSDRITVIHAPRDTDHQYFAISRAVPQDNRLSFEARGVLSYLLSKPSNWEVRIADLQREGNCGRDRIYRILKELKGNGYLHRDRIHGTGGTFEWGPYRVYEAPFTENTDMDTPQQKAAQPFTEKPDTVKPDTVNTEMAKGDKAHQEATQPFTPLPYTENPHIYRIERSTDQRILQKSEGEAPPPPALLPEHPAVALYVSITGVTPPRFSAEMIASQVTDLTRWEEAIKNWLASGFKPGNVKGMLDWYHGKGKHQQNGQHKLARAPADLQLSQHDPTKKPLPLAERQRIAKEIKLNDSS